VGYYSISSYTYIYTLYNKIMSLMSNSMIEIRNLFLIFLNSMEIILYNLEEMRMLK